ncbi:hypothetical protein PR048_021763 [Dryococelus australis]|uniref:Uncharacterized protein n=1 Tax=Dryococelus australis TaxID=614101 RepID=A0ABQ9GZ31_9NEOP|nr:hypothetical protein PR048_021763 [Dryococelus australis]
MEFLNCVGSIDGKQIALQVPIGSLNNYCFTCFSADCQGRISDEGVIENRNLKEVLDEEQLIDLKLDICLEEIRMLYSKLTDQQEDISLNSMLTKCTTNIQNVICGGFSHSFPSTTTSYLKPPPPLTTRATAISKGLEAFTPNILKPNSQRKSDDPGAGGVVDLCFTAFGVGQLVFVRGSINTEACCNILCNEMLPTLWRFKGMDPCYFQDDNTRCHVSRATIQWYADNNVRRLDWPALSPNLNPIEHPWDELDRRVRTRQARSKSITQLMEWLQEEWRRIPVDVLQTLVESMQARSAAVIAARGDPTKNRIRLEIASEKQSSDSHKTLYDQVKRCQERKKKIKASERVNVDVFTQNKRPFLQHNRSQFFTKPLNVSPDTNTRKENTLQARYMLFTVRYTQHNENTARQFRVLRVRAKEYQVRVFNVVLMAPVHTCLKRAENLQVCGALNVDFLRELEGRMSITATLRLQWQRYLLRKAQTCTCLNNEPGTRPQASLLRLFPDSQEMETCAYLSPEDKIDFKLVYTEVTFAIGSEFIRHTLDDSAPIANLQGNKKRIPYCQMWGNTGATTNEKTSEVRLNKGLWMPEEWVGEGQLPLAPQLLVGEFTGSGRYLRAQPAVPNAALKTLVDVLSFARLPTRAEYFCNRLYIAGPSRISAADIRDGRAVPAALAQRFIIKSEVLVYVHRFPEERVVLERRRRGDSRCKEIQKVVGKKRERERCVRVRARRSDDGLNNRDATHSFLTIRCSAERDNNTSFYTCVVICAVMIGIPSRQPCYYCSRTSRNITTCQKVYWNNSIEEDLEGRTGNEDHQYHTNVMSEASTFSISSAICRCFTEVLNRTRDFEEGDIRKFCLQELWPRHKRDRQQQVLPKKWIGTIFAVLDHDGNTARLARRSDEALGVRVSVARIAPSLLDLGSAGSHSS